MKTLYSLAIATCCFGAYAQGTFRNLDFEQTLLIPLEGWGYPYLATSNALPGWNGAARSDGVPYVPYNVLSLGSPAITLQGIWVISPFGTPVPPIQGEYSLFLQASYPGAEVVPYIYQKGRLSPDTRSLTFKTSGGGVGLDVFFDVFFNDTELSMTRLSVSDDYELWGADLSAFSGDYGELKFRGQGELDDIKFSPLEVPEPAAWSILLLGGVVIARFRKRI